MNINKVILECLDDNIGYLIIDCNKRDPLEIDYFLREAFEKEWSKTIIAFEKEPKEVDESFWEVYAEDVLGIARMIRLENDNRLLQIPVEPLVFTKKIDSRSNAETYSDKASVLKGVLNILHKQFPDIRILLKMQYNLYPEHDISEKEDTFTVGSSEVFNDLFNIYDELLLSKINTSLVFKGNLEKIIDSMSYNELVELNEAFIRIKLNDSIISIVRDKMISTEGGLAVGL